MGYKEGINKRIIKKARACLPKKAKIIGMSEVYETTCEWCENKTHVMHFDIDQNNCGISNQYTVFDDPTFSFQSDWWACGKCQNS